MLKGVFQVWPEGATVETSISQLLKELLRMNSQICFHDLAKHPWITDDPEIPAGLSCEKITKEGECDELRYVTSQMQGWQEAQEDRLTFELNIVEGIHCFGVFDGHGGWGVSSFVK